MTINKYKEAVSPPKRMLIFHGFIFKQPLLLFHKRGHEIFGGESTQNQTDFHHQTWREALTPPLRINSLFMALPLHLEAPSKRFSLPIARSCAFFYCSHVARSWRREKRLILLCTRSRPAAASVLILKALSVPESAWASLVTQNNINVSRKSPALAPKCTYLQCPFLGRVCRFRGSLWFYYSLFTV